MISDGLVLNVSDYGEDSKILSVFTADIGKIDAVVSGAKKIGSKFAQAAGIFTFGKFELTENETGFKLVSAEIYDDFFYVTKKIETYYAGLVVLEFLTKFGETDAPVELLLLAAETLSELCYSEICAKDAIERFLEKSSCLLDCDTCKLQFIAKNELKAYKAFLSLKDLKKI